ncbi:MAG TPA: DUF1223 domain-containing protein [Acetobacteraceae bacterium]|nr:DUF1223 domain-containing protein [Acetobacteraceae bacterium]
MPRLLPLLAACLLPLPALASPRVLLELFTSQSCSSCPPADALLAELAQQPGVVALDLHVTYWDRTGWKDRYSLPEATARQQSYATLFGSDEVYTPQLIAGGRFQAVGSDAAAVRNAIAAARAEAARDDVPVTLEATPDGLRVATAAGSGAGTLYLVGLDPRHVTTIGGGENAGRQLTEVNVVRSLHPVAAWSGQAIRLDVPRPPGQDAVAFLQARDGRVLGVATAP